MRDKRRIAALVAAIMLILCMGSMARAEEEPTSAPVGYTVELSVDVEGTGEVTGAGTYAAGTSALLQAVPAQDYSFVGWFNKTALSTPVSTDAEYLYTAEQNVSFVAKFEKMYTVLAYIQPDAAGTVLQSGNGMYQPTEQVTLQALPATGYTFVGWFDREASGKLLSSEPVYSFSIEQPTEVIAKFAPYKTMTVLAQPEEGGFVTGGGQYPAGNIVNLTAVPNEEYRFVGWFTSSNSGEPQSKDEKYSLNLDSDTTMIAKFETVIGINIATILTVAGICAVAVFLIYAIYHRLSRIRRRRRR